MPDTQLIRDLVRRQDQNRYWAALSAPPSVRAHLFALYAFNIELARIAELVRLPQLGEIRLQWWREALAAGGNSGHPVADAFAATCVDCRLPEPLVAGMIDARGFDVAREPMPDRTAFQTYITATAGATFRLAAWIAGGRGEAVAQAAEHAGLAYGLTGLMRALPFHASRGQVFLPEDVLREHGANSGMILRGEDNAGLRAALKALRDEAAAELAAFRQSNTEMAAQLRPVFLPLALVEPYLRRMEAADYEPFRQIVEINPLRRLALIWWGRI